MVVVNLKWAAERCGGWHPFALSVVQGICSVLAVVQWLRLFCDLMVSRVMLLNQILIFFLHKITLYIYVWAINFYFLRELCTQ